MVVKYNPLAKFTHLYKSSLWEHDSVRDRSDIFFQNLTSLLHGPSKAQELKVEYFIKC